MSVFAISPTPRNWECRSLLSALLLAPETDRDNGNSCTERVQLFPLSRSVVSGASNNADMLEVNNEGVTTDVVLAEECEDTSVTTGVVERCDTTSRIDDGTVGYPVSNNAAIITPPIITTPTHHNTC